MSNLTIEWAKSVKADLVKLQEKQQIPALFAAAQMCHESAGSSARGLSELAEYGNNFAGMKWAEWQRQFGCEPVTMGTWEVLDGQHVDVEDAFCKCPTWEVWLNVYGTLLNKSIYQPAQQYFLDPLMYARKVAQCGWATDPNYVLRIADWMELLFDAYADTLVFAPGGQAAASVQAPVKAPDPTPAPIPVVFGGQKICDGWIQNDRTVAPLRQLAESLGYRASWDPTAKAVTIETIR